MRRTTHARRHGTPAERSSIRSNAGLTRTGSCPPPSASAARTTPGGRTSPGWPGSARTNGGHVGVTRRSRSRNRPPRGSRRRSADQRLETRVRSPESSRRSAFSKHGAWKCTTCRGRSSANSEGGLEWSLAAHMPGLAGGGLSRPQHRPQGVNRRRNRAVRCPTARGFRRPARGFCYRLSATDDNLRRFAQPVRDRGAVGHSAQRRLHAIQTLSQLSYSPTVSCSIRAPECANGSLARQQRPGRRSRVWPQRSDRR